MNVASLELCKELFELSGWDEKDTHPTQFRYTLGYLLRKIKDKSPYAYSSVLMMLMNHITDEKGIDNGLTLEDAACKLAIELIRQGVIKNAKSSQSGE